MTPLTPQGSQDDIQYCENCRGSGAVNVALADGMMRAHQCMVCGGTGRTEHNADSPDNNSDTASLPPMATPEQLREAITALLVLNIDHNDLTDPQELELFTNITSHIMQAVATFLASIELPEKPVRPDAAEAPIAYGFKMAIDQCQAVIDKIVEELKHVPKV